MLNRQLRVKWLVWAMLCPRVTIIPEKAPIIPGIIPFQKCPYHITLWKDTVRFSPKPPDVGLMIFSCDFGKIRYIFRYMYRKIQKFWEIRVVFSWEIETPKIGYYGSGKPDADSIFPKGDNSDCTAGIIDTSLSL